MEEKIDYPKELIPHFEKPVDNHTCQLIYWNLIELLEKRNDITANHFIKEFGQTARCDHIKDMTGLRKNYLSYLGNNAIQILTGREKDIGKSSDAINHYHEQTKQQLVSGLNYCNTFYYYAMHKYKSFFTYIGYGTVLYFGGRAVMGKGMPRMFQSMMKKNPTPPTNPPTRNPSNI